MTILWRWSYFLYEALAYENVTVVYLTRISEGATVWDLNVSSVHGQHGVTLRNILIAFFFLSLLGVYEPPVTGFLHRVAVKKPFKKPTGHVMHQQV
jgi:hypothetical protein